MTDDIIPVPIKETHDAVPHRVRRQPGYYSLVVASSPSASLDTYTKGRREGMAACWSVRNHFISCLSGRLASSIDIPGATLFIGLALWLGRRTSELASGRGSGGGGGVWDPSLVDQF